MANNRIGANGTLDIIARPVKATKPKPKQLTKAEREATQQARRRAEVVSYVVGGGCLVGLALSGIDSAMALIQFIKLPTARAAMLAIVINGLMVGAEIATLVSQCPKVVKWANAYIVMAGLLSVGLNAAEFASHASGTVGGILNGIIGGLIPLLVLVSSRYAGHLYLSSKGV